MTKQKSKRYIERKLSVSKLIKMIPDELLENIAKDTTVDYQVKHLNATLMFKLFLFSILKSIRLSSRYMEFFYNSSEFKTFSGLNQSLKILLKYWRNILARKQKRLWKFYVLIRPWLLLVPD